MRAFLLASATTAFCQPDRSNGMDLDHALGQVDAYANGFTSCNLLHGLPLSTLQIDDSHHQSWRFDAVAGRGKSLRIPIERTLGLGRASAVTLHAASEMIMSTQFATLEAEALKLSPEERALLADHLLASLGSHAELEEAWAAEIERRLSEVESGCAMLVPSEQAIKRARQALS